MLNRLKETKLLKIAVLAMALGLFLIPVLASPNLVFISLFFLPLGNGLANPTIQSLVSESIKAGDYGETLGILQSSGSLGRIFGPIIGGFLFEYLGKDSLFYIASVVLAAMFIFASNKLAKIKALDNI